MSRIELNRYNGWISPILVQEVEDYLVYAYSINTVVSVLYYEVL